MGVGLREEPLRVKSVGYVCVTKMGLVSTSSPFFLTRAAPSLSPLTLQAFSQEIYYSRNTAKSRPLFNY